MPRAVGRVGLTNVGRFTHLADSGVVPDALVGLNADASIVEDADGQLASATVAIVADASIAEQNDAETSALVEAVAAVEIVTDQDDTLVAAGTVGATGLTADASITEAPDTTAAAGTVAIAGSAAITEGNDLETSAAAVLAAAVEALADAADTVASTVAVGVAGAAAQTDQGDALAATGAVATVANFSVTLADETLVSAGTNSPAGDITADANIVEQNDTTTADAHNENTVFEQPQQGGGGRGFAYIRRRRPRCYDDPRSLEEIVAEIKAELAAEMPVIRAAKRPAKINTPPAPAKVVAADDVERQLQDQIFELTCAIEAHEKRADRDRRDRMIESQAYALLRRLEDDEIAILLFLEAA